jgi:Phage integrase family
VGLDGFRFHDLRHTAATLAIAAGASTKELMGRLGHSTPAAALRYQHAMEGRDAEIAAKLDQLAQGAEPDPKPRKGTRRARGKRGRRSGTDG